MLLTENAQPEEGLAELRLEIADPLLPAPKSEMFTPYAASAATALNFPNGIAAETVLEPFCACARCPENRNAPMGRKSCSFICTAKSRLAAEKMGENREFKKSAKDYKRCIRSKMKDTSSSSNIVRSYRFRIRPSRDLNDPAFQMEEECEGAKQERQSPHEPRFHTSSVALWLWRERKEQRL